MKKLFISQSMRNRTDMEIISERNETKIYVEDLLGERVEVIGMINQLCKCNIYKISDNC